MSDTPDFSDVDFGDFDPDRMTREQMIEYIAEVARKSGLAFTVKSIDQISRMLESIQVPDDTEIGKGIAKGLQLAVQLIEDIGSSMRQSP